MNKINTSGVRARPVGFRAIVAVAVMGIAATKTEGAARQADFNGDGYADVAVAIPHERVSGIDGAGAVAVIYGRSGGLSDAGDQFWTFDSPGVPGVPGEFEELGIAITVGDFDGDGFSDLAMGSDEYTVNGVDNAGAVLVLYGSAGGLRTSGAQLWHRDVSGVRGAAGEDEKFGFPLAAGDFDGDGRDDLVIGVADAPVNGQSDAGEVQVLYGAGSGLTASGDQIFNQDTDGIDDEAEANDIFGAGGLAVGDFDNDGRDDLAIGCFSEGQEAPEVVGNHGVVHVLYGSNSGLTTQGSQLLKEGVDGMEDGVNAADHFGRTLAAGDFDGDGRDDLAIGVRLIAGLPEFSGAVHVVYGTGSGLDTESDVVFTQDTPGVNDTAEEGDVFGASLASGDFDGNGKDDLAIGVPGEQVGGIRGGTVQVLYGRSSGLSASGDQMWHQNVSGIPDSVQEGDSFGGEVTAGDYNRDGKDDVVVGVVGEGIDGFAQAGAITMILGGSSGLRGSGAKFFSQNSPGIKDAAAENEFFSNAVR